MKKYILITLMLFSGIAFSQAKQPKLEAVGNAVKASYYYDNGQLMQEGFFIEGKLHGEWISYDDKGNKTAIATYDKGQKVGKWFHWSQSSLNEVDYSGNRIAYVKNWKRDAIANED
ncbi:toxin-antitoxin system YwqK family antitoxin [Flavobacterium algicola]|uniref:toxin-antitoxin system YwqK family antitoxin n=1 Tax=Flavobacterium algicola TaxID=556529 RepID=UPI001EFE6783|nr:membrane-binding protein [Flavobacterium algicola]MCG9791705.1 membrane-binding protein [Flavobacterium algicola]